MLVYLHDWLAALLGLLGLLLGFIPLLGDALLLRPEQVHGDGVGVGHLDEFEPLGVEAGDALLRAGQPLRMVGVLEHERLQFPANGLGVELVQPDPAVPALLDPLFDVDGGQVGQVAAAALMAVGADVVVEGAAGLAPAGGVEQPALAPRAGQQPA